MGDDKRTRPPKPTVPSATQKQQLRAARSWVGKFIRDMYPLDDNRQFGFVTDVEAAQDKEDPKEGPRLIVRFRGEKRARRVALSPSRDGHYLYSPDAKARYRLPSDADNERLRALGRREVVKPEKARRPRADAGSHIEVKTSNPAVARGTGTTPTSLPTPTAVIRSRLTIELPKELPALKRQAALDTIRSQFETILCDLLVECFEERPGLQDIVHMKSSITGEQTVLAVAEVCLPSRQPARALVDEATGDLIDFFTREGDPERFNVILAAGPVRYVAKGFRIAVTYKGRRHLERRGTIPRK